MDNVQRLDEVMNEGDYFIGVYGNYLDGDHRYIGKIESVDYCTNDYKIFRIKVLSVDGERLDNPNESVISESEIKTYTRPITKDDIPKVIGDLL
jgi:hypothetical protein